jgi:hypothetical protein
MGDPAVGRTAEPTPRSNIGQQLRNRRTRDDQHINAAGVGFNVREGGVHRLVGIHVERDEVHSQILFPGLDSAVPINSGLP